MTEAGILKQGTSISALLELDGQETSWQPRSGAQTVAEALGGFDVIYRDYAGYVATIGYRLLGRRDEVDDLVQDVFLQVHRYLPRLQDPAKFRSWLITVTINRARRKLRKRKALSWLGWTEEASFDEPQAKGLSPEDRAMLKELYAGLDALPVQERIAWVMWHVLGEKQPDIAAACGCSLATIKRRISRAQSALEEVTR